MSALKSWPCLRCGTELGIIEAGELQVSTFVRGPRYTRDGTLWVPCFSCDARRAWKPRNEQTRVA